MYNYSNREIPYMYHISFHRGSYMYNYCNREIPYMYQYSTYILFHRGIYNYCNGESIEVPDHISVVIGDHI